VEGGESLPLTEEFKRETIEAFGTHPGDSGRTEVQVALLTRRISDITEHLRIHRKDYHTQLGLMKLVGQRRRLLRYLQRKDPARHRAVVDRLGLRG
jgi:small subunit ribosomal protein S15